MRKSKAKVLCVCLALILLLAPVSAYAAETEETYWPGKTFKSIAEFESYLSNCHQNGSFDNIGEYYSTMKSMYIPKALKNYSGSINYIAAEYYSYYDVVYKFGSTEYRLGTYYGSKPSTYDFAKEIFEKKETYPEYRPQKTVVNGHTVYSYYVLQETTYCWEQDGVYHYLRVNRKPNDKAFGFCDAEALPLNIQTANNKQQPKSINDNPSMCAMP